MDDESSCAFEDDFIHLDCCTDEHWKNLVVAATALFLLGSMLLHAPRFAWHCIFVFCRTATKSPCKKNTLDPKLGRWFGSFVHTISIIIRDFACAQEFSQFPWPHLLVPLRCVKVFGFFDFSLTFESSMIKLLQITTQAVYWGK